MKPFLRIFLPLAVLAAGAFIAVGLIKTRPAVEPAPREDFLPLVRVVEVHPAPHQFTVQAQGTVAPHLSIDLTAEVQGRIASTAPNFAPGGFFNEGQELLMIDPRDYELAVVRAEAQLAEARVRLAREQAEAEVAKAEWTTLGEGEASPLLRREPQLAEARAAVAGAEAALRQARLDLERCRITAPFSGRVAEKRVDLGQYVTRGAALARVYSSDYAEVRLPLPLEDLAYLNLPLGFNEQARDSSGPSVLLRGQVAGQTHEWRASIVRTEAEIDPRTRMIHAVARVKDPFGRSKNRHPLPIGLFVQAEIEGISKQNLYAVPRAALRGTEHLLLVDEHNHLRFREVEIVRREAGRVLVRSGLNPGDRVCVSPLDAPVDGMRVRVAENNSPAEPSR